MGLWVRVPFSVPNPIDNLQFYDFWFIFNKFSDAGWSSLVARRAYNPKVVGSNPTPATTFLKVLIFKYTFQMNPLFRAIIEK